MRSRGTIDKFLRRFEYIYRQLLADGKSIDKATLVEMDKLWDEAKERGYDPLDYFLCVMGMVLIVEGLPYLVFPEKLKPYLIKITTLPDSTLRMIGISTIIFGLILLYFGRR
ncbi:MAG: DUF2065 family protein [Desulfobacterales bacterium]|nr:DUF2065 family protein [Desulfobacterales bacterium]